MKTVFELSKVGRHAYQVPESEVFEYEFDKKYLSASEPDLPEVDEVTLVRHYMELSDNAYGVDNGF